MKPTDEQQAILDAGGRVLRINARAGTGKTTSLVMLAEKHPEWKILYLVFNRKAKESARQRFPANVQVHTVHSFAFRHEGYKWQQNLGGFSAADLLPAYGKGTTAHLLAALSHQFLTYFLNSPYERLEAALDSFARYLPGHTAGIFAAQSDRIVATCRELATAWNRRERPCAHDFYLKLFHKSETFQRVLNRYDLVLVDEAQDLSPIMLDALEHCRRRIVLVGDSHQQIYSFRYAMDAMRRLACDEELQLTLSFRFGSAIADLARVFIQEAKQEHDFRIAGNPHQSSRVWVPAGLPRYQRGHSCAILSRTNLALFSGAMRLRAAKRAFRFERDLYPVLFRTLDVYWLSRGQKDKIRDVFVHSFESVSQLREYAETSNDFPLLGMAEIVKRYGDEGFPAAVYEMSQVSRQGSGAGDGEGVVLATVHSAKGQEYEEVYIDSDVADTLTAAAEHNPDQFDEEVNVAYVGFTRAAGQLRLPSVFRTLLTDRWRNHLRGLAGTMSTKVGKPALKGERCSGDKTASRKAGKKRRPLTERLRFETEAKPAPKQRIVNVGERVQTPHGPGRVLEIAGGECLVDLDEQPARLWQKLSSLRL